MMRSSNPIVQVTGAVHINTQKDDVKVAKIILEVEGVLETKVTHKKKKKDGKNTTKILETVLKFETIFKCFKC